VNDDKQFDDTGKVALWDSKSTHPKAPALKGHIFAHRDIAAGEKVSVGLWENERYTPGGNHPRYRGKVEDLRDAPRQEPAADPAPSKLSGTSKAEAGFDDDIPF
jgi:hypothetical protein